MPPSYQILARPLPGGRPALFLGVLLVHLLALWILGHLIIFPAPPVQEDETPMQRIALPAKLVPPPSGGSASANALTPPALTPPAAPPVIITTPAVSAAFNAPKVTALDDSAQLLANLAHISQNLGAGTPNTGTNAGQGTGKGDGIGDGTGRFVGHSVMLDTLDQYADQIADIENAPALKDVQWGKYHQTGSPDLYRNSTQVLNDANQSPATVLFPSPEVTRATQKEKSPDISPEVAAVYILLFNFEDAFKDDFTDAITKLRANHTRLIIVAFGHEPYPDLAAYAQESGGIVVRSDKNGTPADVAAKIAAALPK